MKVARWIVCVFLLLSVSQPVAAQCSKRILLYVDISGSMRPTSRDATSPFMQVVGSLGELLEIEGFVEDGDVLEVQLFGERIEARQIGRGAAEIRTVVNELRNNSQQEADTNFEAIFVDLKRELENGTANRQLVIIASDFSHDPAGIDGEGRRDHWVNIWRERQRELEERFGDDKSLEIVLFQAQASSGGVNQATADVVLADLTRNLVSENQVYRVGSGGEAPEELARQIRRNLLWPLEVRASLAPGLEDLDVRIVNDNCLPVDLARVTVQCIGQPGDPRAVPLPAEFDATLPAFAQRELAVERPICSEDDAAYEIAVTTVDGDRVTESLRHATDLRVDPIRAVWERHFLFGDDLMRVHVELSGVWVAPRAYEVRLELPDGQVLGRGTLEAPRFLGIDPVAYQIPFFVEPSLEQRVLAENQVKVVVQGASIGEGGDLAPLEHRLRANQLKTLFFWIPFFTLFVGWGWLWLAQRDRSDRKGADWTLAQILGTAGLTVGWALYLVIYDLMAPRILANRLDFFWIVVPALAAGLIVGFFAYRIANARLRRAIFEDRVPSVESYARRIRRSWVPLVWAFGAVALIFVITLVSNPEDIQDDGRARILLLDRQGEVV